MITKSLTVCICFWGLFCCSITATAQLTSHINCLLPISWDGRQVKLVITPLDQPTIIDTATVVDRYVQFNVNIAEPAPAYIWIEGNKDDINFLIDSPQLTITVDPQTTKQIAISGSPSSELWQHHRNVLAQLVEAHDDVRLTFSESHNPKDSLFRTKYGALTDSLMDAYNQEIIKMIQQDPLSISGWLLFSTYAMGFPYATTLRLFNQMSSFKAYPSYKSLAESLRQKRLGVKAIDFTLPDLTGNSVTLSKLKSKFILLDFSNAMMSSCQQRHNALRKIYETYQPLGLEILTISAEFDQRTGTQLIQQEHLPWIVTLEDRKAAKVTDAYRVSRVPDNVLLDGRKVMVGRDLSAQELESLLKSELKKGSN